VGEGVDSTETRLVGGSSVGSILVDGKRALFLLDTGSVVSSVCENYYEKHLSHIPVQGLEHVFDGKFQLSCASGSSLQLKGYIEVVLEVPGVEIAAPYLLLIVKDTEFFNEVPILVGTNVLNVWKKNVSQSSSTDNAGIKELLSRCSDNVCAVKEKFVNVMSYVQCCNAVSDNVKECFYENLQTSELLGEGQANELRSVLWDNYGAFAHSDLDLGHCDIEKHEIKVTNEVPFKEKYRRIPPVLYDDVKEQIDTMLKNGVIEESYSPWASTVTIAVKKDGRARVCVDYRTLNNRTKKDAKSLPRIDETLESLAGASWFTALDLMSGFWQVEMEEKSREYTAFTAGPLGFYQFKRLPFGLSNSGSGFQRMMEKVLKEHLHKDCLVYIDDIIIYSTDFQTHLEKLDRVLKTLQKHNLKLKMKKCMFMERELTYLGHTVAEGGITKDAKKTAQLDSWKEPTNVKELRRFIGFTSYCRKFMPGYAKVAKPLTELLRGYSNQKGKGKENRKREVELWKWGKEQQEAFDELIRILKSDVQLDFADFSKPFRVQVDACKDGLGAVLEQLSDGHWRPIQFASRATSESERKYATHRIEFLALKWAVTEKFKEYLYGKRFHIFTDNNPLTYVMKRAKLDAVSQRWVASLADFDFEILYKPGENNVVADALSRLYCDEDALTDEKWNEWIYDKSEGFEGNKRGCMQIQGIKYWSSRKPWERMDSSDWAEVQKGDADIQKVIHYVEKGQSKFPASQWKKLTIPARRMLAAFNRRDLGMRQGLLMYRYGNEEQECYAVVIPPEYGAKVTQAYHENGHFGIARTMSAVRKRFYWPDVRHTVVRCIQSCDRCIKRKTLPANIKSRMGELKVPSKPFEIVSMDFLSVDTRKETTHKVLTVVDELTKYGFAIVVTDESAVKTARALYENVITKFGCPSVIHTDNGKTFVSKLLKELWNTLGVGQSTSTIYRPQGNATCERLNQTILQCLGTLQLTEKKRWKDYLSSLMFAYNTTIHDTTGYSPFYLMFGRVATVPVDLMLGVETLTDEVAVEPKTYVRKVVRDLQKAYNVCNERTELKKQASHDRHDNKIRKEAEPLKLGSIVLL
jgi:transposase InsO family protein